MKNAPIFIGFARRSATWLAFTGMAALLCQSLNASAAAAVGDIVVKPGSLLDYGGRRPACDQPMTAVTSPQPVSVNFDGPVGSWTATSDQPWLRIDKGFGSGAGQFTAAIVNTAAVPCTMFSSAFITVTAPGASNSPFTIQAILGQDVGQGIPDDVAFGQVDTPAQSAAGVQGAIAITGWALDHYGVTGVKIYRTCFAFDDQSSCQALDGASLVYVADATLLAGARPDVEAAYPGYPLNYRAGWGVQVLTNMLPDVPRSLGVGGQGAMSLSVYATNESGLQTLLGRAVGDHAPTNIALDNDHLAKPIGNLDTPAPGGDVSGVFAVFGWAITPDATPPGGILIPTNGSTVTLFVDGQALGPVTYNQCRGTVGSPPSGGAFCDDDVSNMFGADPPQAPLTPRSSNPTRFRNLDAGRGAIGVCVLDTRTLTNGPHVVAWAVRDSAGRSEGVGSRWFTVLNEATGMRAASPSLTAAASGASAASDHGRAESDHGRRESDRERAEHLDRLPQNERSIAVRTGFDLRTKMTEVARVRGGAIRTVTIPIAGRLELSLAGPVSAGYLVTNREARDLPVGSTLDVRSGVFTWMPPPGYLGTYRLAFVTPGGRVMIDVVVTAAAQKNGAQRGADEDREAPGRR